MGRNNARSPFCLDMLPTEAEVADFDPEKGPCCTVESFRPDLTGKPSSQWNLCAREVFVAGYMENGSVACEEEDVDQYFKDHLKYLIRKFKQAHAAAEIAQAKRRSHNRRQRRRSVGNPISILLFLRRLDVAQHHPGLQKHVYILQRLGPEGMSSDESEMENGRKVYKVFVKSWRAPAITPWLSVIDAIASLERTNAINGMDGRGAQFRERRRSSQVDDRSPPVGRLFLNAYSETWLQRLTQFTRSRLKIRPKSYKFAHSPEVAS
ncbi:hypothetical protein C8Q76DRAFT_608378 [Earliella scabrosa]|nr:hypothetical protein C8Q76DRAFT_608378 [Earliella scabrosa]